MQIVVATTNAGKFYEIQQYLQNIEGIDLLSLQDFSGSIPDIEETGTTFQENALLKAKHYAAHTGLPTIAEDSGIEVSALLGELGVKTRRWGAGEKATDEEWMQYFLKTMESKTDSSARFYCSACFYIPNAEPIFFQGFSDGYILTHSDVPLQKGIPLSSYFVPHGYSIPFAALDVHEKNSVSHRGKAMDALKKYLISQNSVW